MKIGCFVNGVCKPNRTDQWLSCRCEARAVINAGFGFALMNHEVDIVSSYFEGSNNIFPGVNLRNNWDINTEYDIVFTWGADIGMLPSIHNYKELIFLFEPSAPVTKLISLKDMHPRIHLFTAARLAKDDLNELMKHEVGYFPLLFPIPCLPGIEKQDFQDFKFDKDKKDINVWVFIDAVLNYHIQCDPRILDVLRRLREIHGYKMNVTMHRCESSASNPVVDRIISEFEPRIVLNKDLCYLDMLNTFSSMDICITKGGTSYCGNSAYDIISLGKLMIYVTEGKGEVNVNDMYDLDEYVIRQEDSVATVNGKVDKIILDPQACYSAMKERYITFSFPEWSKRVTEILNNTTRG